MRHIRRIILIFSCALLYSCTDSYKANKESFIEQCDRIIGESDRWKVIQVNDSVLVCIPTLNADKSLNPVVINLKNVK